MHLLEEPGNPEEDQVPPIQEAFCCPLRQSLGAMMRFTAAKLGAVHASVIVVVRGRREAGSWRLVSLACAEASHVGEC
jgi:hypothetical protein